MSNTVQGALQQAIRTLLGCAYSFNGDLHALCDAYGVTAGALSGRLISLVRLFDTTITTAPAAFNYLLQNSASLATLNLDFTVGTIDSRITFTRASTATYFNSAGVLSSAAVDAPRFDYDPSTLVTRGLMIEEARTNKIRNNTMVGAVVGTPGTLPTFWSVDKSAGQSSAVVGFGVENGLSYVDIRLFSAVNDRGYMGIYAEPSDGNTVAAGVGEAWTSSQYVKLVGGAIGAIQTLQVTRSLTAGGVQISDTSTAFSPAVSTTNLAVDRVSNTTAATPATTGRMASFILIQNLGIGAAFDITLRVGLPQLEKGAFASSPILTSGVEATRAADIATMAALTPWYNQSEGTLVVEADLTSPQINTTQMGIVLSDGTSNEQMYIGKKFDSTTLAEFGTTSGGVAQAFILSTPTTFSGFKMAGAYKLNDFAAVASGGTLGTDAIATPPTLTQAEIGKLGTNYLNGHVKRVSYYPVRLANATLQSLTT